MATFIREEGEAGTEVFWNIAAATKVVYSPGADGNSSLLQMYFGDPTDEKTECAELYGDVAHAAYRRLSAASN